jgi:hypothetical protein
MRRMEEIDRKRGATGGHGRRWWRLLAALSLVSVLSACGGSGGGSTPAGTSETPAAVVAGIALPTEVSAISADNGSVQVQGFGARIRALAAAAAELPAGSDYATVKTIKYVDEPTLKVFGIIETILKAIAQTNYADPANIGASEAEAVPYKAIVAWEEDNNGRAEKQMQEWVLKSFMSTENNQEINVVHVWINQPEELIKVECKIVQAPSQNADGTYLDYGKWQINAGFVDDQGNLGGSFYADADIDGNGNTVLRMSDDESHSDNVNGEDIEMVATTKAIVRKDSSAGYGKAIIPDWGYCRTENGDPSPCAGQTLVTLPTDDITYAYNQSFLALQAPDGSGTLVTVYKDRSNPVEINYRYGLYDASTGQSVEKTRQFGFPVRITVQGQTMHGYYGAWQGRHQLWAGDNMTPPDGTSVEKEVWGGEAAASYTTKSYQGTLTKRTLVPGNLSQIQDIPVEIWLSDNFDLRYDSELGDNGAWKKCTWDNANGQQTCSGTFDLGNLAVDSSSRKQVNIGGEICADYDNHTGCTYPQFSYVNGSFIDSQNPGIPFGPDQWKNGDRLWVNVNGSTYIVYDGDFTGGKTGWVEKALLSFDQQRWTPVFVEGADTIFAFPADREYYINNQGANFVVRREGTQDLPSDYVVKMEVQNVVRPNNVATVLNGVSYFAYEWEDPASRSTYAFNPTSMLLEFQEVGSNDSNAVSGNPLEKGSWGLVAFNTNDQKITNNDGSPLQFNWEYATQNNPWGAVTYLINESDGQIQYLADPVALDPLALTTLGGDEVTFSLRFDGWMHGLPDMHWELVKNNFVINDAIKNKVANIPAGTLVTSGSSSYFIKPIETGVILPKLDAAPPDAPALGQANDIDLEAFNAPEPTAIGDLPTDVVLKVVEGKTAR